ncbi:MAG: hypothetical protein A2V66_05110 [Ignavibacteria bacterium RBG_13_36_8]|nr:MAG: hypothetical protein A2V66_05110 [Ignavibacteria bacterium RBG_13_36_8]
MEHIEKLSCEDLLKLIQVYAKNWLAHDGCWFLAAEEKYDLQTAIELDKKSWEKFAVTEARRIMNGFNIPQSGGLKALEKAFQYRLYTAINKQQIEWIEDHTMIFKMIECRVQKTRRDKNLPPFPCKEVGIVEFIQFTKTIDAKIEVKCISCPPDETKDFFCSWEFTTK